MTLGTPHADHTKRAGTDRIAAVTPEASLIGDRPTFNLSRWFLGLSFIIIGLTSILSGWLVSSFVKSNSLRQDAAVTMAFVSSIIRAEQATDHFLAGDPNRQNHDLERLFTQISKMPDVIRATLYGKNRVILWSSDEEFIGSEFPTNPELDLAFSGELVVELGIIGSSEKAEHAFLKGDGQPFVENYIPVYEPTGKQVVGVAEVYKSPTAMLDAIHRSQMLIWASAVGSGLVLYIALAWIIRRADLLLRRQQVEISQTRALSAIGEMSAAVAHGLRNPLASIRTSAELALEGNPPPDNREAFGEIVAQADRLEGWISELLTSSNPDQFEFEPTDVNDLIASTIETYEGQAARQDITLTLELDSSLPQVKANRIALGQVLSSLFSNAIEAMANGGTLRITSSRPDGRGAATIAITDSGSGIAPGIEQVVFRPFVTTKGKGLGIGLPLAQRIVERHGGKLSLRNASTGGTVATIEVPTAE